MSFSIINSRGFWQNGWLPNVSTLDHFVSTLKRQGVDVQTFEVENASELDELLSGLESGKLLLPNAYHVNPNPQGDEEELIWMSDVIAQHSLGSIGPRADCLKRLLQKHVCQSILQDNGVLVPEFCYIPPEEIENADAILKSAGITYPAIVKLTGESSGVGISKDSVVNDSTEAVDQILNLHQSYHQGIIVETYLPGPEFTAARFEANGEALYLIAEYQVEDVSVFGYEERSIPWGKRKRMVKVQDPDLLREIEGILDQVWKALDIKDVFRLDGRLDQDGRFRVFDVNGFPALTHRKSATPILCETIYSDYSADEVYEMLANTIVFCAAQREGIQIPNALSEKNFFKASLN